MQVKIKEKGGPEKKSRVGDSTTKLTLKVKRELFIYLNFYHINRLLQFVTRTIKFMNEKRVWLINECNEDEIKTHIRAGFEYLLSVNKLQSIDARNLTQSKLREN